MAKTLIEIFNVQLGSHSQAFNLLKNYENHLTKYNPLIRYDKVHSNESINFKLALKDIYMENPETGEDELKTPQLHNNTYNCCFPGVDILDAINGETVFEEYFKKFIMQSIRNYIVNVVHEDTKDVQDSCKVYANDQINWDEMATYYSAITQNLEMFGRGYKNGQEQFSYILQQPKNEKGPRWKYRKKGIRLDEVPTIEIAGFNKEYVQMGAMKQAMMHGDYEVNRRIKHSCSEYLAIELFYLRFKGDSKKIKGIHY